MFYGTIEKYYKICNFVLLAIMPFFIVSCQNGHNGVIAMKQVHEQRLQVVSCSRQQREVVISKLLVIGYSSQDATKVVAEMTDEEVQFLYKNPKAIKRSGFVFAIFIILGLAVGITWIIHKCNETDKAVQKINAQESQN